MTETINSFEKEVEERILHTLSIYPILSISMLQISLGSPSAKLWKPIYQALVDSGKVKEEHIVSLSATGRSQSYTLISLKDTPKFVQGTFVLPAN